MSGIYSDYIGARHLIGDDYTEILLLHTAVSNDFPTVALWFSLIARVGQCVEKRIIILVSKLYSFFNHFLID